MLGFDELGRPDWDVRFMAKAFLIAQGSIDPPTKQGAVWVSKENKPLSEGYNGPIRGIDDTKFPLNRPDKYYGMIHSEINCLLFYNGSDYQIEDSTIYITGIPCHVCLKIMIQKGVKKIIYGCIRFKAADEEEEVKARKLILELSPKVELIEFKEMNKVKELLKQTIDYIDYKNK